MIVAPQCQEHELSQHLQLGALYIGEIYRVERPDKVICPRVMGQHESQEIQSESATFYKSVRLVNRHRIQDLD